MENDKITAKLFEMQDLKYREFHARLIPNINPDTIIGVRSPALRKFAAEIANTQQAQAFMKDLPHKYYDENNLHGFLIEHIKDYDSAMESLSAFLPHIDNWATCDQVNPKIFKKHLPELLVKIKEWLCLDKVYITRYAIESLMRFYLDDYFMPEYLEQVSNVKSEEYYVNMMIAWYFATALAKQYDAALPYIEQRKLTDWTHHKTIKKAIESFRITEEHKAYLRTLE